MPLEKTGLEIRTNTGYRWDYVAGCSYVKWFATEIAHTPSGLSVLVRRPATAPVNRAAAADRAVAVAALRGLLEELGA